MTLSNDRNDSRWTRRGLLQSAAAITAAGILTGSARAANVDKLVTKGRLHQSVCRWCFAKTSLDELCSAAQRMGLVGIDLWAAAGVQPRSFRVAGVNFGIVARNA